MRKNKNKNKNNKHFKPNRNRREKVKHDSRHDTSSVISFILYCDSVLPKIFDRPDEGIVAAQEASKVHKSVSLWELAYTKKCELIYEQNGREAKCHDQFKQFLKANEDR